MTVTLRFDAAGDLVDFASDDRGELQPDGRLLLRRWTTPRSHIAEIGGRRVPRGGQAVYHRPEGPFACGEFDLSDIRYDAAP